MQVEATPAEINKDQILQGEVRYWWIIVNVRYRRNQCNMNTINSRKLFEPVENLLSKYLPRVAHYCCMRFPLSVVRPALQLKVDRVQVKAGFSAQVKHTKPSLLMITHFLLLLPLHLFKISFQFGSNEMSQCFPISLFKKNDSPYFFLTTDAA